MVQMAGPVARVILKWLPVALGLAVLAGFVGYRLFQRAKDRSPELRGTPISAPALERKTAASGRTTDLLNRLGLAMSLRDAQTAERLAEELSRAGDAVLPGLVRLLLWLDPVPPEPVFDVVLKYFPPRPVAMTALHEVSTTLWIGIGPAPRRLRILIARGVLEHSKEQDPAIDIGALLSARFANTARIDGRLGLTFLAIHLKDPGWEKFVKAVLPALKDQVARDELLATIGELFGGRGAAALGPLLLDPDYADARTGILRLLHSALTPEETLSLLVSIVKPDAERKDQLILADAVATIVEKTGMDLIRRAWTGIRGAAPKCGILIGLGDLKPRPEVGGFLLTVARSTEEGEVRATALLSLRRHGSVDPEAFREILLKESDPDVLRACLATATDLKMAALRETVQKLALNSPDEQVKAAAEHFLRLVR